MKTILKLIAGVIVACAMVCYPRAQNQLIANLTVTNNATFSARTATRVPYFSTGGLLADSATLTYNIGNGTLSATNFSGLFNGNVFTTGTGTLTIAATKTFTDSDNITIASDGIGTRTLNVGSGGTLGSAAFTPSSAYEVPLTFSTGLTRTINTITIDSTVMTLTGSQVVTNKSISGATNTLTAIPNSALTNSSITIGSTAIALGGNSATLAGLTSVSSTSFTGALTGNATTATALAAGRTISTTGDVTYTSASFNGSGNVTGNATLANIPTAVPMAGTLLATAIAAPGTPAAGKGSIYVDSTSKNLAVKDDAGVVKHGVQTNAGAASNFLTAISDAGVVSRAQPAFSDLSGSATAAQMPAFTGDITTSAGSTATTLATVATAGTTGSSTVIPVVTINAKGLTTGITTAAVIAPAGTLTGTTLASNVVTSSLTSLGTLGSDVTESYASGAAGTVTLNARNTTATGMARISLGNDIGAFRGTLAYYGSTHASRAAQLWLRTEANEPLILAVNDTEVGRVASTGFSVTGASSSTGAITAGAGTAVVGKLMVTFDSSTTQGICIQTNNSSQSGNLLYFINSSSVNCGSIAFSTGQTVTLYNTTSDARLKTNIRDFVDSGRMIDALRPRMYDWRSGEKDAIGFVAQEENAIDPIFARIGAVTVGDDDPVKITKQWQRSDTSLIPIMVAEIKSLRARVAVLEHKTDGIFDILWVRTTSDLLTRSMAAGALIVAITALVRSRAGK